MVEPDKQRSRYLGGTEGAPPVPPAGGYHGARRTAALVDPRGFPLLTAAPAAEASADRAPAEKRAAGPLGWIALIAAILFVLVLLSILLSGGTDLLYGITLLVLQLVIVGVVIAACLSRRGRMLGGIALTITLLLNIATVGGMSALQTSASGNYQGQKTEEQKFAEAYPGIPGVSESTVLAQMSLEDVRAESDAALADVRQRLSERYGYTWTQSGDESLRNERNGHGGESMLVSYTSQSWITNEPIQDYTRKIEVMNVIEDVLVERGMYSLYSFNDPASSLDDTILQRFYGTADPETQHTWEWYTDNYPDPMRFYAILYDLSNDPAGELAAEREAETAQSGVPMEGLEIFFLAPELLSEDDAEEFSELMQDYDGF
ncbi:hypothetical protein [uncultured Microbacterium sp.]|uniref:hypothetical protein n=1 Tax=uncultured Microbacterium sp. TaxID=191216 RepID=UPI0026093239|nr:hypothetical protein [uncultured Microbacterium sp.]